MSEIEIDSVSGWPEDVGEFARRARGRSFAMQPAFRRAFAAAAPGWPPCAVVARRAGAVVGALPGYLERRLGGTWFQAMPLGAPGGPLLGGAAPDEAGGDAGVARALWQGLGRAARRGGWLGGRVTLSAPASEDQALWPPSALGRLEFDDMHVVDLAGGVPAWRARLRKRARQQFTKAERLGVAVEATDRAEDLARVHALHADQARDWGHARVRPLAFYEALLAPPTDARLWVARVGGEVVCGVLVFVEPEESYVWWSGSSRRARETLAFPALLARAIEECGSRRVNLGFSGRQQRLVDFKEQMGAEPRRAPILRLAGRPRTPYHALLGAARERMRAR